MPIKQAPSISKDSLSPAKRPLNTKTKHNRSRGGCVRCRQRRQKCDELRPQCNRCKSNGIESCVYTMNLQWGGRDFASYKDNSGIKKYETEPGTFVYVASPEQKREKSFSSRPLGGKESDRLSRSLSPLDSVTQTSQLLLHHFATSASRITSCHASIQSSFCGLLLPMATSYPPLLSALLALSLIHRTSLYLPSPSSPSSSPHLQSNDREVMTLKNSSITQLRSEILLLRKEMPGEMRDAVLATALTLCMCEIHSGADQPMSWRLHLEGAKAILSSSPISSSSTLVPSSPDSDPSSQPGLLERWYTSIEALAATSSKGLRAGDLPPASEVRESGVWEVVGEEEGEERGDAVFLDDYFGFCTDLVQAFKEIGALAWERRSFHEARTKGGNVLLSEEDLLTEARLLESRVTDMILRDHTNPPRFYPGVRQRLEKDVVKEFYLCNEAYQYAALLHIYCRVMDIDREDERVQGAVKRILECVEGIVPREGLSPYIVLTMPLFTAGREALDDAREIVRIMMRQLGERLRLRNVWRSLEILEEGWRRSGGEDVDDGDCDFIPY